MTGPTGPQGERGPTGFAVNGSNGVTGPRGELSFTLPNPQGTTQWCCLGAWATDVTTNRTCTLRLCSQNTSSGLLQFRSAFLQLNSGGLPTIPTQLPDGSTFYANAELQLTSAWPNAVDDLFLEQLGQPAGVSSQLSFRVWLRLYASAGAGHYTATPSSGDTWTHDGSLHPARPSQVRAASVVASPTGPAGPTGSTGPAGAAGPTGSSGSVVFALPNVPNSWIRLGTMTLTAGTAVVVNVCSNALLGGHVKDELYCTVRFSTSNGTSYVRQGANGQPFYGEASISQSLNFSQVSAFAVQQNSTTSYSFFFDTSAAPGAGFFTVESQAAFVYSGSATAPSGCFVYPNLLFEQGIQDGEAIFTADSVLANSYGGRSEGPVAFRDVSGTELLALGPTGSEFLTPVTMPSLTVATGPIGIPDASLSIAKTSGLQTALDSKAHVNVQYTLFPNVETQALWFELGTFTSNLTLWASKVMRLQVCFQEETTGTFRTATLCFSLTDKSGTMSYDTPSIAMDCYAEVQTDSPDWWSSTLSTDFAVKRITATSHMFFVKVPGISSGSLNFISGFFSVHHSAGDTFTYTGYYRSPTRPTNAFHPPAKSTIDASMFDPNFTGETVQCATLAATGSVTCNSVTATSSASLRNLGCTGATFSGTVTLPQFQVLNSCQMIGTTTATQIFANSLLATLTGFSSAFGTNTMVANSSQTLYQVAGSQRGLIFVETDPALVANAQSTVAYFTTMSGVNSLSVLARNGNALGSSNLGTAASGTYTMTLTINSAGAIRASIQNNGNLRWNVLLLSAVI